MQDKRIKKTKKFPVGKKSWYIEISIGFRRIIKTGDSLAVTIPKSMARVYGLKQDDKVQVILHKRVKMLSDEMDKEDMIKYMQFKKKLDEEKEEARKALESIEKQKHRKTLKKINSL